MYIQPIERSRLQIKIPPEIQDYFHNINNIYKLYTPNLLYLKIIKPQPETEVQGARTQI